jgi:hypothetical protein
MAGLEPAIQQAKRLRADDYLRPQTRAHWMAGSSPATVNEGKL